MIASKGDLNMSWRRGKSSGWAAFDQKQKQKDNPETRPSNESFPSLLGTMSSPQPVKTASRNKHRQVKSFSSVVLPSVAFPVPLQDNMKSRPFEVSSSEVPQTSDIAPDNDFSLVISRLKELFSWADDSLIEDIMAAAGNDFDKAASFLKVMVSDQSSQEHQNVEVENHSRDFIELGSNGKVMYEKKDAYLKDISESARVATVLKPYSNEGVTNDFTLTAEKLFDDCMEVNEMLGQLTCVPVEPDWEEDDVYLTCRKDAIKMMRAAARHSKAANNSFLRGDHISAQQFSLKAREEWRAAQSLNKKAACDILSIRNENNETWRLDLHGLHASEAVQAVKERLYMIETQVLYEGSRPSELPNNFETKPEALRAPYLDGCNYLEKSDGRASHRLKPIWLEVITGIGNHSRGGVALPSAVRNFLADNGYRFDEARPGVIMVRPKFRSHFNELT